MDTAVIRVPTRQIIELSAFSMNSVVIIRHNPFARIAGVTNEIYKFLDKFSKNVFSFEKNFL
jgi:hypothetical protein